MPVTASFATVRMPLVVHFLRHLGPAPWHVVAGGRRRPFAEKTLPELGRWLAATQGQQLGAYAILPDTEGLVWHLAVRAPSSARPAAMSLPPSLIISSDEFVLLWRLNEPVPAGDAQRMSAKLAAQIGGKPMVGEAVPLPGTILVKATGVRLVGRFAVQMLPPIPIAYRLVDGALTTAKAVPVEASPFTAADTIEAKPIEWLWPGLMPLGALTLLGGAAGMGKSQAAVSVAATVSTGGEWATGGRAEQGSALVLEAEDDLARTVTPRLMAAGADLRRVGVGKIIDLTKGPALLEAEWKRRGDLRLVVLSPIRKFLGDAELHGNIGVRNALQPVLDWAEHRRVALLGVIHPPKGKEQSGDAFAGSTAFVELARAAFSVIADPEDENPIVRQRRRIMIATKANLAADDLVLGYRIDGAKVGDIETSRVRWEGDGA